MGGRQHGETIHSLRAGGKNEQIRGRRDQGRIFQHLVVDYQKLMPD
jgi:hypothetical protein